MRASKLMFYLWASAAFVARIKGEEDCSLENQCVDGNIVQTDSTLSYTAGVLAQQEGYTIKLNDNLQDATPTKDAGAPLQLLPKIHYNREELDDIIEKIPLDETKKSILNTKLWLIENRIDNIHDCLRSKKPEDYYSDMRLAITEVQNVAKQIYELARPYRITLANQLQKKILNWLEPLDKELAKIMEITESERRELELKTKRLYAEQSFACRQAELQVKLMEHLGQTKEMLLDTQSLEPHCYLSYAWPSPENKGHEYLVQPFLSILYDHLKFAGIEMIMDIRNNKPGHDINQFMRKYKDGNHIILIGTESLLRKHASYKAHAIKTELSIINERFEQDQEQYGESRIYPLLISGTHKSSFPEIYDKYRTVREARDGGYVLLLKNLIEWLYSLKIDREANLKLKYQTLWNEFLTTYPGLPRDCTEAQVMQELAEGYHRKRLDELNQDLVYQSIKAQQEVKHSEAVTAKIIAVYMESIGPIPQKLFDETGAQFQRPYSNPDFIQRQNLWDKMTKHFASREQQILTLAAKGLGGMGKTELAARYFQHPPRPYSLRVWFRAGSKEQLYTQYVALIREAESLEYPKEMPIEEQAKLVKRWIEEQKDCLLVYDNVEKAEDIESLLPQQGKHHVLITSRSSVDWPQHQVLDVDTMEEHEAIALIVKITVSKESKEKLQVLVKALGCLPLALAQAGAYMVARSKTIEDYLTTYAQFQEELLKAETRRAPKHEPIWITFDMNFKALEMECPAALQTLKQSSWLASSAIPEILLLNMINIGEEMEAQSKILIWDEIKESINKYSLMRIKTEQHVLDIHPILQGILLSKQTQEERETRFIEVNIFFDAVFRYLRNAKIKIDYKNFLSHAECLNQHGSMLANRHKDINFLPIMPNALEDIYVRLMLFKKHLEFLKKKKEIFEKKYGNDSVDVALVSNEIGGGLLGLGNPREAKKHCELALSKVENHYHKEHIDMSFILNNLGRSYQDLGSFDKAKEYFKRLLGILEMPAASGGYEGEKVKPLINLAVVLLKLGLLEEAEQYADQALNLQESCLHLPEDLDLGEVYHLLGEIYAKRKNFERAEEKLKECLKIKQDQVGPWHVKIATVSGSLGSVYRELGRFSESKEYLERALERQIRLFGKEHFNLAPTLINLGSVYAQLGAVADAETHYALAIKIREAHFGKDHLEIVEPLYNLALLYKTIGQRVEAENLLIRSKQICENNIGGEQYLSIIENLLKGLKNNSGKSTGSNQRPSAKL